MPAPSEARRSALPWVLLLALLFGAGLPGPSGATAAVAAPGAQETPAAEGTAEPPEAPEFREAPEPPEAPEPLEPAEAPEPDRPRRPVQDTQVSVGSSLTVEEDEVVREAVVIGGSLRVLGEVVGDAAVIGGPLRVEGKVTGSAVSVGGSVFLGPDAMVLGDVVAVGGRVEADPGAEILGRVSEVGIGSLFGLGLWPGWWRDDDRRVEPFEDLFHSPFEEAADVLWQIFFIMALSLLACVVVLLARTPVERMGRRSAEEGWKSGAVGLLSQILFLPVLILVVVVLCVSVIGIPLLLLVPFALIALAVMGFVGYTAVVFRVGMWATRHFGWDSGNAYLAVLTGVLLVQGWWLVAELLDLGGGPLWILSVGVWLLGFLVQYVVWTVGFGAALLSRFGTSDGPRAAAVATAPPGPPVPPASPPTSLAPPEPPAPPPPPAGPVELPPTP